MRTALAIFVAVIQIAGPWLCCCGPAQAFAAVSAPVLVASDTTPQEPTTGCPVCAKLAVEKGQRDTVTPAIPQKPTTPRSPGLPEPCPCGGVTLEVAPPATLESGANDLVEFASELAFTPRAIPDFTPIAVAPTATGVSELPFLPPGDRTRVHHVLHC